MQFSNRTAAGAQLAARLADFSNENVVVLALPRGGVTIGYEVAKTLRAPLDVVVVRKLGAPDNPEFGFGAIAPNDTIFLDRKTVALLGLAKTQIASVVASEAVELRRREKVYRGERPFPQLKKKTAIVVDDGLATGATATAAVRFVRQQSPRKIILAVPVAADDTAAKIRSEVDELVCLQTPLHFGAVGAWYDDFTQVTDAEVITLLQKARRA